MSEASVWFGLAVVAVMYIGGGLHAIARALRETLGKEVQVRTKQELWYDIYRE
jgi:hypothetical protein